MKCPDCNGSGSYQGLSSVEECKLCQATGEVTIPDHLPEDMVMGIDPGAGEQHVGAVQHLEPAQPEVGHKIFIAQGFDIECEITEVDTNRDKFNFEGAGGRGVAKFDETGWNAEEGRWEIV